MNITVDVAAASGNFDFRKETTFLPVVMIRMYRGPPSHY
jgi:hypothetical protein